MPSSETILLLSMTITLILILIVLCSYWSSNLIETQVTGVTVSSRPSRPYLRFFCTNGIARNADPVHNIWLNSNNHFEFLSDVDNNENLNYVIPSREKTVYIINQMVASQRLHVVGKNKSSSF